MAYHQLAFGTYAAALLQWVALAAHGVALDAFGGASSISFCGGHQALVEHHYRFAVGAYRFGHTGGGFKFGGDGVGHRRYGAAHRRLAHIRDDADDLPFALFTGDDVIGHVRAPPWLRA